MIGSPRRPRSGFAVTATGLLGCLGIALALSAGSASARRAAVSRRSLSAPAADLSGFTVGIDPGHNGRNYTDPSYIDHLIWNGREYETCNTTGTETDGGYTEAQFNFNVATYLQRDLIKQGAKVVLTRHSNNGVGPCVNVRAAIINHAHANVAIDIHADGGPPYGRGFAILEPVADGPNDKIIAAASGFGDLVRAAMLAGTTMPVSTYDGVDAIEPRDNLAGLNLTTVPEVLIESGNMRDAIDAALLVTSQYQQNEARALDTAITRFLIENCHRSVKTRRLPGCVAAG
jgi:N-acetylmuramoyl-L-alanine amidase